MLSEQVAQPRVLVETDQIVPVAEIDEHRMTAFTFEFRLDKFGAGPPALDEQLNDCWRNCGVIDRRGGHGRES